MTKATSSNIKKTLAALIIALMLPMQAYAADQADLMNKIDDLSKQLEQVKQQLQDIQKNDDTKEQRLSKVEKKSESSSKPSPIEFSGDYRFRYDSLAGKTADGYNFNDVLGQMLGGPAAQLVKASDIKNNSLMTNRLGLNIKAKATEDITVKARLVMYKVWGHDTSGPVTGSNAFFADKSSIFDGNVSHIPEDNALRVDQVYATWSNIFGQPIWFSVGRRPSTGGAPTNLRQNKEQEGSAGTPGLLVDYAFDGMTLGVAPDIDAMPGAYAKLCYGRGFDSGFRTDVQNLKDVDMLGLQFSPYSTENLSAVFQWNRAFNLFGFPETNTSASFGKNTNLGDIDQFGGVITGKIEKLGPGDLNLFTSTAASITHPNTNLVTVLAGGNTIPVGGMLYDAPGFGGTKQDKTGYSVYLGGRYDIVKTSTKIGAEYNYGSKNWITFTPASDDMWTSKLGTRGNVYEVYLIQDLNQKAISRFGKAYLRLGYQNYQFNYTGSNNWVGSPKKITELNNPMNAQMFSPLKTARDLYLT
ncbi:MAG TPA: DUF3373 family protein, partial [Nitrospirota bacterium]